MRRLFSVLFTLIGLFFLTALAAPDPGNASKYIAAGLGIISLLVAWRLWRASNRSIPPLKASSAADTALLKSFQATTTQEPKPLPPVKTPWERKRAMLKAKVAFEDLKHLHGVPGMAMKQRVALIIAENGIRLVQPDDWDLDLCVIRWNAVRGIATSDAQSVRDDGLLNSVRSGSIAKGQTLGGAIALEAVGALMSKSPLIISYQLVPEDPMLSTAVFNTWENEEIARRLLAYRTNIVASGSVSFLGAGS